MTKNIFLSLLLFFSCLTVAIADETESEQENTIKLHVIHSKNIQNIMQRLSLALYDEYLTMDQINELFDLASELLLAAKKLNHALPGIELTVPEKSIFENVARQLQIEANNMGYMAQQNDMEGIKITYQRLQNTCVACHELFRF